jgi:hypothetical protein
MKFPLVIVSEGGLLKDFVWKISAYFPKFLSIFAIFFVNFPNEVSTDPSEDILHGGCENVGSCAVVLFL